MGEGRPIYTVARSRFKFIMLARFFGNSRLFDFLLVRKEVVVSSPVQIADQASVYASPSFLLPFNLDIRGRLVRHPHHPASAFAAAAATSPPSMEYLHFLPPPPPPNLVTVE